VDGKEGRERKEEEGKGRRERRGEREGMNKGREKLELSGGGEDERKEGKEERGGVKEGWKGAGRQIHGKVRGSPKIVIQFVSYKSLLPRF
jgi:hypothetical protein